MKTASYEYEYYTGYELAAVGDDEEAYAADHEAEPMPPELPPREVSISLTSCHLPYCLSPNG